MEISCPKVSPPKVGLQKKVDYISEVLFAKKVSSLGELRGGEGWRPQGLDRDDLSC